MNRISKINTHHTSKENLSSFPTVNYLRSAIRRIRKENLVSRTMSLNNSNKFDTYMWKEECEKDEIWGLAPKKYFSEPHPLERRKCPFWNME